MDLHAKKKKKKEYVRLNEPLSIITAVALKDIGCQHVYGSVFAFCKRDDRKSRSRPSFKSEKFLFVSRISKKKKKSQYVYYRRVYVAFINSLRGSIRIKLFDRTSQLFNIALPFFSRLHQVFFFSTIKYNTAKIIASSSNV